MPTTLRGMTWDHPRGYDPMVATSAAWLERTGTLITWDKRSLQDFESFPVAELARQYDLIVIDHPHVGQITAEGCLTPLDIPGREKEGLALAKESVGQSYASYAWQGRQWALPIDAAAQVMAYRADLIDRPPSNWSDLLELGQAGQLVLPMLEPHGLITFMTLAANCGTPCLSTPDEFIAVTDGVSVYERLAELTGTIPASNFSMDPIAASEALASPTATVTVMPFGYGYANYARGDFRPRKLTFGNIPTLGNAGPIGSVLGGTGIAVSAQSRHTELAIDYAYWVASKEAQIALYARAGGQPGNARAWEDAEVNQPVEGFYRDTRATLEGAWMRPRYDGYMRFQKSGAERLNQGLIRGETAAEVVIDLNRLYRESVDQSALGNRLS